MAGHSILGPAEVKESFFDRGWKPLTTVTWYVKQGRSLFRWGLVFQRDTRESALMLNSVTHRSLNDPRSPPVCLQTGMVANLESSILSTTSEFRSNMKE